MDAKKNFDSVKEKIGNIFHFQFTPLKIEMFSRFQFQFRPEFILFLFLSLSLSLSLPLLSDTFSHFISCKHLLAYVALFAYPHM
jgi:hypothetical protein